MKFILEAQRSDPMSGLSSSENAADSCRSIASTKIREQTRGLYHFVGSLLSSLLLGVELVAAGIFAVVVRVFLFEVFERLDVHSLHHESQHVVAALRGLDGRVPRHASAEDFFPLEAKVAHVLHLVVADRRLEHLAFDRQDVWRDESVQS